MQKIGWRWARLVLSWTGFWMLQLMAYDKSYVGEPFQPFNRASKEGMSNGD
jgi:hypothetical protein